MIKSRSKIAGFMAMIMILSMITTMGIGNRPVEAVEGRRGGQTFVLPIVNDDGTETYQQEDIFSIQTSNNQEDTHTKLDVTLGEKEVSVYIPRKSEYIKGKDIPVIIKIDTNGERMNFQDSSILLGSENPIEATKVETSSSGEYVNGVWKEFHYIIGFFPESLKEGDYEIAVKLIDIYSGDEVTTDYVNISFELASLIDKYNKDKDYILDSKEIGVNLTNIYRECELEVNINDKYGHTIFTSKTTRPNEFYKNYFQLDPFSGLDVYGTYVNLLRISETTAGLHDLVVSIDGEEIYTEEIKLIDKKSIINSISLDYDINDGYLFEDDREFNIRVYGSYLNRKDDISISIKDDNGNEVATSIDSYYRNYSITRNYNSDIIYKMKVLDTMKLDGGKRYSVILTYSGNSNIEVKPNDVSIYARGVGVARHAEIIDYEQGIVNIYGFNFKEDEKYTAQVRTYSPEYNTKNYSLKYLDKNTLELNMDEFLDKEEYNLSITDSDNNHIGYLIFKGQNIDDFDDDQTTKKPYIEYIPGSVYSVNTDTIYYWMQLRNTDEDISNYEINLLDKYDNIVAKTVINEIYPSGGKGYELSLKIELDPNLNEGEYFLSIKYKGEEIFHRNKKIIIKLVSGPFIETIYADRMMAFSDTKVNVELYNFVNIDLDKLNIQFVDLYDNVVSSENFTILNPDDYQKYNRLNIELKVDKGLAEGHYYIRVLYDGKEIKAGDNYETDIDYYRPLHVFVSKEKMLTDSAHSRRFNLEDKYIYMTYLLRSVNLVVGEDFNSKLYKVEEHYSYEGYRRQSFEYVGEVQSKVIKEGEYIGVGYDPKDFLDYEEGEYRVFLYNKDGSIFDSGYFRIYENRDGTTDPDDWDPDFNINNGAVATNSPKVALNIDLDGGRGIGVKIANTEEGLKTAEEILFTGRKSIDWQLTDGDGLKTVYMNILDANGYMGPILREITLDTILPEVKSLNVDKDEIEQGEQITITATITEKSNVIAKLYKDGKEVRTMNMVYAGISEGGLNYRVRANINQDVDNIVVIATDNAGNISVEKSIPFKVNVEVTRKLTISVENKGIGYPDYTVSVYNYKKNIYRTEKTNNEGIAEFDLAKDLNYEISIYKSGYSDYANITLVDDYNHTFWVPTIKEVTGKALVGTNPVEGATIIFTGEDQQYYAISNSNGDYKITVGDGNYNIRAEHPLYASVDQEINKSESSKDIIFYNKYKLTGVARDSKTNNPIANISIYAYGNKDWQRVVTGKDGSYELNLINDNYNISTSYIQGYTPYNEEFNIDEDDLKQGGTPKNIDIEPINYDTSFSGNGNNIKTDASIIQRGKSFNIVVNYTNNGHEDATGIASMELPVGLEKVAGQTSKEFNDLKPGESGKFVANIKVSEGYIGSKIVIPAKIAVGGKEYPIGFAEVDVIDVTINAPMVSADGKFKVYGNVTAGSKVSIINKDTGELLAIAKVIGNLYTAEIKDLVDGEYNIFAKAVHGANIENSETKNVKVDLVNGIGVEDILITTSGGSKIGMNHEIGVPAFTAWVDMSLRGNPIEIDVKLSKEFDGMKVEYLFADKVYDGTKVSDKWNAILSGWSGSGTKQIIMRITVGDIVYEFVVGQIIILIDPSGYVFDEATGDRIQGATVTLEKLNELTNTWEFWTTDPLQLNPLTTDEEGKYGWMVEDGKYRVKVEMEGYRTTYVGTDGSIIIPPPREDVNIGLKRTLEEYKILKEGIAPSANHPWTIEFNQDVDASSVTSNNVYIMDENGNKLSLINPRVDGKKIILDNTGSFTKDKKYTIVIKKTVKSKDGKSLDQGINMKFTVK